VCAIVSVSVHRHHDRTARRPSASCRCPQAGSGAARAERTLPKRALIPVLTAGLCWSKHVPPAGFEPATHGLGSDATASTTRSTCDFRVLEVRSGRVTRHRTTLVRVTGRVTGRILHTAQWSWLGSGPASLIRNVRSGTGRGWSRRRAGSAWRAAPHLPIGVVLVLDQKPVWITG
jgi:hypothetical protein